MAEVKIPIRTQYDGRGFTQLERDARRAQQEAIRATRAQIAEHNKVLALTRRLDKDLAGPQRPSFATRVGMATGVSFGATQAIQEAAEFTKDFTVTSVQAAAAEERLGKATDNLGRQYGLAGKQIVASIQEASDFTINRSQAMQHANQAMLLGVAKSETEFAELTKLAVALGRAMGQDANKSVEDLTIGIGRQSRLILDNLGIIVDAEKAYEKYARSIGKSASDLTDAEKKQAFKNETLEQGRKKVAQLGDGQLDTAGKVERLSARYADLQASFGKFLLSVADGAQALDAIAGALGATADALDHVAEANKAIDNLKDHALEAHPQIKKLQDTTEGWQADLSPTGYAVREITELIGNQIFNADELAKATQEANTAAEDQAAAEEAAAAAMEEATKAAEELAKKLEKINQVRRSAVRDMMDIEAGAQKETRQTWEDYYNDTQAATAEHNDAITAIKEAGAEEQARIEKDLAKDLAQVDKDLARDLIQVNKDLAKNLAQVDKDLAKDKAKLERDTSKQISRMQQDAAREEKRQRRQRQIEAKGDQRLFDFEMRQLAAEGEFNEIQAAMERRAIEQQIAAKKQTEEDRTAKENSRIEIQRARQDAADRKQEMEAEAEERKQQLQIEAEERRQELTAEAEERRQQLREQAAEEIAAAKEKLAEELAAEEENYQQRMDALAQHRDEKLAALEEGKQEALAKLAEELTETGDLTREELEALVDVAEKIGADVGAGFAKGISSGFAKNEEIDRLLSGQKDYSSSRLPGTRGRNPATGGDWSPPTSRTFTTAASRGVGTGPRRRFAGGGDFVVPPGFPNDTFPMWVSSGERVTVQPQNQAGQIVVNVNGIGGAELAAIIRRKVEQGVQEYHDQIIVPWSNGN